MKDKEIKIAGHMRKLFTFGRAECGHITDGIGLYFKGEGGWVLSRSEMRKILDKLDSEDEKENGRGKSPRRG